MRHARILRPLSLLCGSAWTRPRQCRVPCAGAAEAEERGLHVARLFVLCARPHRTNYADSAAMPTRRSCAARQIGAPAASAGARRGALARMAAWATGFVPGGVQTAEGELEIEIPQVRQAAGTFASKLFPRKPKLLRTEPLKALMIGAFVRGLSKRDVESLCEQAGLGKLSMSTASRMCEELRERFEASKRRDLYDIRLVALSSMPPSLLCGLMGPRRACRSRWGSPKKTSACCSR
jgi:Transposase, Mutator family